jgi:UDP-N-acetylglucosamine--N-acetylmuramyl-(pentapeptide) pyrophosphoryl-undecaprenol N-acetylglucosamine transferase
MTCGGTGGHINPAIAIANTIKSNLPDAEILFVGTEKGQESKLVPHEGYEIEFVKSEGIRRSLSPANVKALIMAKLSPYAAKKIIRRFKPDVIIGTGGYACWPMLKAASMTKVPSLVHESNAILGMAVKVLQKSVDKILVNFERTADALKCKDKVIKVGNPLRTAFENMDKNAVRKQMGIPEGQLFVLSYGGSGGAEYLNETMVDLMGKYLGERKDVRILHATGSRNYEESLARYKSLGADKLENAELCEYIYDMHAKMAAADVVICRAGAMTVSELSMMGKSSIIIPSPNVVDNHQYKNAKVLADADATLLIEEKNVNAESLWRELTALLDDPNRRKLYETNIKQFANTDANQLIFDEIMKLVKAK